MLAMSTDIRVILVKLADRLHNMRTLRFVASAEARRRKAFETMKIYAPIADRLGMSQLCLELETLAFRELHPTAFTEIASVQQRHNYSPELQTMLADMRELWAAAQQHQRQRQQSQQQRRRRRQQRQSQQGRRRRRRWRRRRRGRWSDRGRRAAATGVWSLPSGEPLLRELHVQMTSPYRIWRMCRDGGLRVDQLQLKDFFDVVADRAVGARVLPGARRAPLALPLVRRDARLHLDAQAQPLPVAAHHRHRTDAPAGRRRDPHAADAYARRDAAS